MTIEIPIALLIALYALNSSAIVAFIGIVAFVAFRLGSLPTRHEHNELRNEFKADMERLRNDAKVDMERLRNDVKADNAQLREDFRRSHQQLMLALVNHSHRDDGSAVFTAPPELETTPTPADN